MCLIGGSVLDQNVPQSKQNNRYVELNFTLNHSRTLSMWSDVFNLDNSLSINSTFVLSSQLSFSSDSSKVNAEN